MKFKIQKYSLAICISVLLLVNNGCKKVDFGDLNRNPNQTTEPITAALLTNVIAALGNTVWDQGGIRSIAGYYAQYFSQTQYTEFSRYAKTTTNMDLFYSGPLNDLQNMINYNSNDETKNNAIVYGSNNNQVAVARILKAYYFWWITDLWGDIPYFEALKGNGNIPYDKQQDIYPDLLKELKEAVAQFDGGLPAKGDILFYGDISKWKKFANSLRMLIALQMSNVNATLAKSEFASALADPAGSIESNADNAFLAFPGGAFQNMFYNYYNVVLRDDEAVAKTLTDWLNSHNDRRINVYGSSAVGFPYGLTRDQAVSFANANSNYARPIHPSSREETDPIVLIGAANVLLARAEAAFRGWTAENYTNLYYQGIEESWRQWNVYDAAAFNSYKTNADVDLSTGDVLKKIAIQQWLAWYPNGVRGWATWRRTGFPVLTPAPGQSLAIPRRMAHGPNESQLNPSNYAVVAEQYKVAGEADSQWGKMWWDN